MSLLFVEKVSKIYQSGGAFDEKHAVQAVANVSLKVEARDCLGLVGESGSGKSTLGRMIVGLEKTTGGRIFFNGRPAGNRRNNLPERHMLQMVFQASSEAVNPRFSAKQIIAEPLRNFRRLSGNALEDKVLELLATVGIPGSEGDKLPRQFSGGQLQRICIARALAAEPSLIVLDEPLRGLDVSVQAQILNLLYDLKQARGVSFLLISHDLEAVYYLSNRIAVMFGGKIVEQIDDISLFGQMRHPYAKALIDAADCRLSMRTLER